jgi:hypothetical protein
MGASEGQQTVRAILPQGVVQRFLRPTMPGTNIPDLMQPALVRDGDVIYESYPGLTTRDYSKPAHVIEDNGDGTSTVYETFAPGNIPNKMNGGYVIQNR